MNSVAQARRIEPEFRTKIWGSPRIGPWFEPRGESQETLERIGEVWFPADDLLIKFIFTSENLSVQVHPDDEYARRNENSRGKNEMWHILRADPGARIALGFKEQIPRDEIVPSAESGRIMELLNWIEVHPGETYFVPAGTVHAIGAGIALCEIQQNSDLTYRLFDYGRARELHLRSATDVIDPDKRPGRSVPREVAEGIELLVECPWFRVYQALVPRAGQLGGQAIPPLDSRFLVVLEGTGCVNGLPAGPGQVFENFGPQPWTVEPESTAHSGPIKLLLIA